MKVICLGLMLSLSGFVYGMHHSPPSHTLQRHYKEYYTWLKAEKKMHSSINLALYIDTLIHENVKIVKDLVERSEKDLDFRVVSKDLPFDPSRKSFGEDVAWPMQEVELRARFINYYIKHLEMLKPEVDEQKKIMSKL